MAGRNLKIIKLGITIVGLSIVFQLARWQIVEHTRWNTEAKLRHQLMFQETPERGEILASDGSKLAYNEKVYGVYLLPREVDTISAFSSELSKVTKISASEIQDRLTGESLYVALKHKVSPEETLEILRLDCEMNGGEECDLVELENPQLFAVRLEEETKRVYPEEGLASHVLGYVGQNDEGNEAGKYGVEGYYNGELEGKYGYFIGLQDQGGRVIVSEELQTVAMKRGTSIELTIDRGVQRIAEKVVKKHVLEQEAKSGTIVVMRPSTGALLAVANYPTFNPNQYWKGETVDCTLERYEKNEKCTVSSETTSEDYAFLETQTQTEEEPGEEEEYSPYDAYIEDPTLVYKNEAVSDLYEPGSVVKILTVASGLDSGAIKPDSYVEDHTGCIELIEKKIICTWNKAGHTNESIEDVLFNSCNIGASYIAKDVGADAFYDYFNAYGIGHEVKPGMEGEKGNVFPLKDRGTWNEVDLSTAAFGQGVISVTPIQLISALNTVANNGTRVQPHVVSKFIEPEETIEVSTQVVDTPISEDAAYQAIELLQSAIERQGWYHRLSDVSEYYTIAGKTGTAQIAKPTEAGYYSDRVITNFVGWVPAHDPDVIILVRLKEPQKDKMSYITAVPMWNEVAREVLAQLNVPPDRVSSDQ